MIYRCKNCAWRWDDSSFFAGVTASGCPKCTSNLIVSEGIEVEDLPEALPRHNGLEGEAGTLPCYCVCHTPISSNAYCEHCKGDNEVGRHHGFAPTPPNEVDELAGLKKQVVADAKAGRWQLVEATLDTLPTYITKQNQAYHAATTDPIVQAAIGWYNMRLHKAAGVKPKPEAAALLAAVHDYLANEESKQHRG